MKSIKSFFAILGIIMLSACSQFDDSAIIQQLKDHETRISELERQYKELQQNINSLASALSALEKHDYIKSVTPVVYGGEMIGYTITFVNSEPITIYHGKNGEDGKDAPSPLISIKQDTDGVWYWILNGTWLLDDAGNKIKAVGVDGEDGKDGVTPQVKIVDEYWYVSTDNGVTWTKLEKATGENGKDGDSFFKSVVETDTAVILTLADGTEISLPKYTPLNIAFEYDKDVAVIGTIRIPYVISGQSSNYEVEAISSFYGWEASVEKEDNTHGNIVINANGSSYDSKIIVFVTAENGETTTRVLSFEKGIFSGDVSYYEISAEEQTITFQFKTNLQYQISIPEEAKRWIQISSGTKAIREESIILNIKENTTDNYRTAEISFISQDRNVYTIEIIQYAGKVKIKLVTGGQTKAIVGNDYDFEEGAFVRVNEGTYQIYKEKGAAYVEVPQCSNGYNIIYPAEMYDSESNLVDYITLIMNYPKSYSGSPKMPYYGFAVPHEITPTAYMTPLAGAVRFNVTTDESLSCIRLTNTSSLCGRFEQKVSRSGGYIEYSVPCYSEEPTNSIGIDLTSSIQSPYAPLPDKAYLDNCNIALFDSKGCIVSIETISGSEVHAGNIYTLSLYHSSSTDFAPISKLGPYFNSSYGVRAHGKVMAIGKTGFIINDGYKENLQVYTETLPTVAVGDNVIVEGFLSSYAGVMEISKPFTIASFSGVINPNTDEIVKLNKDNIDSFSDRYSTHVSIVGLFTADAQYNTLIIDGSDCKVDVNTTQDLSSYNNKKVLLTGYSIGKSASFLHMFVSDIEVLE